MAQLMTQESIRNLGWIILLILALPDSKARASPPPVEAISPTIPETNELEESDDIVRGCQLRRISIPTVPVGYPGNQPDGNGYGSVSYSYFMAQTEITNQQYAHFLNAVADENDTFELYSPGGIQRLTVSGRYCYVPKPLMENKPVNNITWLSAARFVNWLENGQPHGSQTERTTESGVYDLSQGLSAYCWSPKNLNTIWSLPTRDEWMKAARFDPTRSGNSKFWAFATRSDLAPIPSAANELGQLVNPGANVVNYMKLANWNGSTSGNVTTVGSAGDLSRSYFGTYDMNGNVAEWTDESEMGDGRIFLGGSFLSNASRRLPNGTYFVSGLMLQLTPLCVGGATYRSEELGFRVVMHATE